MYSATRNDIETLVRMDGFWKADTPVADLIAALDNDNWQIQQAALLAIGDRGEIETLPAIEALLAVQDGLGIYACPEEWNFDDAKDEAEKEMWRCRFRVKQAALLAIGRCVDRHGPDIVGAALLQRLMDYAVSQENDYPVRIAACEVLGRLKRPESKATLEQAASDGEWCTAMTAKKSLDCLTQDKKNI